MNKILIIGLVLMFPCLSWGAENKLSECKTDNYEYRHEHKTKSDQGITGTFDSIVVCIDNNGDLKFDLTTNNNSHVCKITDIAIHKHGEIYEYSDADGYAIYIVIKKSGINVIPVDYIGDPDLEGKSCGLNDVIKTVTTFIKYK